MQASEISTPTLYTYHYDSSPFWVACSCCSTPVPCCKHQNCVILHGMMLYIFSLEKSSWHYWYLEELSRLEGKPCNPLTHTHTLLSLSISLDLLHAKPFGLCPFLLKFKWIISSIPNTWNGDRNKMFFGWWVGLGVMNYNLAYRGIGLWWWFASGCSFYLWYYTL
jgi:hypothetical protein